MKKLMALILAVMMALSFASVAEEEIIKLTWAQGTGATAPIDNAMVLEELNKMSRELIGVEMDIQYFTDDQLSNSINTGEVFDIYFTCGWYNNFNKRVSEGLFLDLTGLVEQYAPDLWASMTQDVWNLAKSFDGGLYAIPVKKDYAMMNFMTYPTEIAEELGFEIPDRIESFGELTPFLTAWKEAYPEEYPYLVGGGARGYDSSFDFIDRISGIGCVFGTTEVVTVYDDPAIIERLATLAEWYDLGIINPDAAQLTETAIDTSKKRIDTVQAWPGYDYSVSNGYDTSMTCYFGPHLSADSVQGSMNALSVTLADQPEKIEAALKYIELCHTNQLFVDTLRFGVQGYHWNYITEGPAAGGVQRTQVGSDNYAPWSFSQPAYFETSITVSADQVAGTAKAPVLNQYDLYYHEVETNAKSSAMKGFTMDLTPYAQQLAEMQAIKDEYYASFATGTIAFEEVREEFLGKMYAAGLQDMIDAAQEQLDAWLAQ